MAASDRSGRSCTGSERLGLVGICQLVDGLQVARQIWPLSGRKGSKASRLLLEDTRHSLEAVAREVGFIDLRRMLEVFMRKYGQPPQALRRMMRAAGCEISREASAVPALEAWPTGSRTGQPGR